MWDFDPWGLKYARIMEIPWQKSRPWCGALARCPTLAKVLAAAAWIDAFTVVATGSWR